MPEFRNHVQQGQERHARNREQALQGSGQGSSLSLIFALALFFANNVQKKGRKEHKKCLY